MRPTTRRQGLRRAGFQVQERAIDFVYVGGTTRGRADPASDARPGITAVLMGGDALVDKQSRAIADRSRGLPCFTLPLIRGRRRGGRDHQEVQGQGHRSDGYTLYSYAAFQVWSEAVARARTRTPEVAAMIKAGSLDTCLARSATRRRVDITSWTTSCTAGQGRRYAELQSGH